LEDQIKGQGSKLVDITQKIKDNTHLIFKEKGFVDGKLSFVHDEIQKG